MNILSWLKPKPKKPIEIGQIWQSKTNMLLFKVRRVQGEFVFYEQGTLKGGSFAPLMCSDESVLKISEFRSYYRFIL